MGIGTPELRFAGSERTVSGKPQVNTVGQRITYDWDATLQEWFVNDQRGLEHGFTVRQRPALNEPRSRRREEAHLKTFEFLNPKSEIDQSLLTSAATDEESAPLIFTLAVRGGLRPEVQADGRGVRFVDAQGAATLTYSELTVLDADGRKLPARFEPVAGGASVLASRAGWVGTWLVSSLAPPESPECVAPCLRLVIDERGARYPLTIDPIAQQAYLKASNAEENDLFGSAVAVSGDTVVIGARFESSNATGVNGNQSNNSAWLAGASYVFTGVGHGPSLVLAPDGSSGYFLRFTGAPDVTYRLQRAPNMAGPWSDITTNTAPASGLIEYQETTPPPGAAFDRTVQP